MKNSFFLVIPKQHANPLRLQEFEVKILQQWIDELPTANTGLAARLIQDFIVEFNSLQMPVQLRLDTLELLRPSLLVIEDYLRARLMRTGFPKDENDMKILRLLVSIEKEFTISYWIALKKLTRQDVSWLQGKNAALLIQRSIKGLSSIVISYFIMGMPIPDWVWMDLHSLYQLSVKIKKESTKVTNDTNQFNKSSSPEECYLQIILLSLADSTGLMQKEIPLVYRFIETIVSLVTLKKQPISSQPMQCVILTDEDKHPYYQAEEIQKVDSAILYIDFTRLYQAFEQGKIPVSSTEGRFSTMYELKNTSQKPTLELLTYLKQSWSGIDLQCAPLFSDRLDRNIAIGLTPTYKLQKLLNISNEENLEFPAQSESDRLLSAIFDKTGVLSVGSLVSFRKTDQPEHKRSLGVVDKLIVTNQSGKINFGMHLLTHHCHAVDYIPLEASGHEVPKKALLYSAKEHEGGNYIIIETFMFKEGDFLRVFIKNESFSIALKNKKNLGLGYWQFECLKVVEKGKTGTS
ncbi:MAG: hypothetical protein ACXWTS_06470 [Methylococcaceae bacterium]